ncbi:MAG: cytochrome P450 [Monoraphidium minutum]|nr:MAG: cytochrome P450 [Monoraphidium minutum]
MGVDPSATAAPAAGAGGDAGGGCPMRGLVGAAAPAAPDAPPLPAREGAGPGSPFGSRGGSPVGGGGAGGTVGGTGGGGRTILDLAVQYSAAEGPGGRLDVGVLRDQLMTFFAAGHDTTASLVAWTVNFLCEHPEAEERMAAEITAVLGPPAPLGDDFEAEAGGGGAGDGGVTWQQLNELKYMTCVLKETLRLRPPVGVLARWGPEGSSLAGYDTSNKVILVSPFLQQTDAAAWGPDAGQWRPERWEDPAGAAERAHPYSYMPFSRGPRDCIGSRFALLEAKTVLAMVYHRYRLVRARDAPEEVLFSVTAHPKHGVPVRVLRRGA